MRENLREVAATLWRHRELLGILVGKELKARYRGSVLGLAWTFLNPLLLLSVYALVFSVYMRIQTENYAVMMFAGLLPWIWFTSSLTEGVNAVTASANLLTKSMFPAEILPMVKVAANLVNYLLSLPLLLAFMIWYGVPLTGALAWFPLVMGAQLLLTVGLVYLLAAVNVRFRDTQHLLGNLLLLWFFLCPIIYPLAQVPEEWRFTFALNPPAVLTIAYQEIFLHGRAPALVPVLGVLAIGALLTAAGINLFVGSKETFAEEI